MDDGVTDAVDCRGGLSSAPRSEPPAGAMLIRHAVKRAARPAMTWADGAMALWLCIGIALAPLRYSYRWNLCAAMARLACRSQRGTLARRNVVLGGPFPDADAARVVHELYTGRLAANLDVIRGLLMGPDARIDCRGLEHIDAALARGRGVILWISDFLSAGDVTKLALARAGYRVTHLSREEHGFTTSSLGVKFLNPFRVRYENRFLEERVVFDRMNPGPAMSRLRACLRANRIVSIMASAHEGGTQAEVPFLSGRLRLSIGALRLAHLCGTPLIAVHVLRDQVPHGAFEATFEAPISVPEAVRGKAGLLKIACAYRDSLEARVRANPGSWAGWRRSAFRSAEK